MSFYRGSMSRWDYLKIRCLWTIFSQPYLPFEGNGFIELNIIYEFFLYINLSYKYLIIIDFKEENWHKDVQDCPKMPQIKKT